MSVVRVWSFGAGRDSLALLRLMERGACELPDVAIWARISVEPESTERQAADGAERLSALGVPFVVADGFSGPVERVADEIPWKMGTQPGRRFGRRRRQCTREYKIRAVARAFRVWMGLPARGRPPGGLVVESWIGFNADETDRARRAV